MNTTRHLLERASQRGYKIADIEFILENSKPQHNAGVIFYRLRKIDLPKYLEANDRRRKLTGSVVVVSACGCTVITVHSSIKFAQEETLRYRLP